VLLTASGGCDVISTASES